MNFDTPLLPHHKPPFWSLRTEPLAYAVGVITAPRPIYTLPETLSSLHAAGWEGPAVFAELGAITSVVDRDSGKTIEYPYLEVHRDEAPGCYRNWRFALRCILNGLKTLPGGFDPPDFILLCEDDIRVAKGTKEYLEKHRPPRDGILSLYAAAPNHSEKVGWNRLFNLPRGVYGALAIMMTPAIAEKFLAAAPHPEWAHMTDLAIGLFCRDNKIPFYCHSPSLAQHFGHVSTFSDPGGIDAARQAKVWVQDAKEIKR